MELRVFNVELAKIFDSGEKLPSRPEDYTWLCPNSNYLDQLCIVGIHSNIDKNNPEKPIQIKKYFFIHQEEVQSFIKNSDSPCFTIWIPNGRKISNYGDPLAITKKSNSK